MKKINKKAFTLIELLAVIVILALIALIAVPMVIKIMTNARKSAAEDSSYGILKAAENYIASVMLANDGVFPNEKIEFDCSNNGCELSTTNDSLSNFNMINFNGKKPTTGKIIINDSKVETMHLEFGNFICIYPVDDGKVKCSDNDGIIQINNIDLKSTQDSISVTVDTLGNVEKYEYSLDDVTYFESTNNTYEFNNLDRDTLYTVYVKISANKKTEKSNKTIKTLLFPQIIYQLEDEDNWTKLKVLTINYPDGEYVKKYKILSGNVEGMELNSEYTVADNVINLTFNSPGKIETIISDGEKSQTDSYEVNKVDSEIPSVDVITNDLSVTINSNDNSGSGIDSYCIVSSAAVELCEFTTTNDDIINIQMESYGKYYAYVKDKAGNISLPFEFDLSFSDSRSKVASYDYTKTNGNILLDVSGNNNDATMNNVNATSDGLLFDGKYANDYISFSEFNSQTFSINVVFKLADFKNESQMIIANVQYGGIQIYIDTDGYLATSAYIDGEYRKIQTEFLADLNKVYAVMVTYNNNVLSMYVNGEFIGAYSSDKSLTYPENNTIFMAGQNPDGTTANGNNFIGSIYYINFYDEEVLANEIQNIHYNNLQNLSSNNYKNINIGLISQYDYTIDNNKLIDLSGNNNNGKVNDIIVRNNSLVFDGDGVNDYITLYRKDMNDFSVTATFSSSRLKNGQIINNTQYGGCQIYISSSYKIVGSCYINGAYREFATDYIIEPNQVYTATLNFDNNVLTFYVNQQLIGTYSSNYGITHPEDETIWIIGQAAKGSGVENSYKLDGNIYSILMYGRGLNETEILSIQDDNMNKYPLYTQYSLDTSLLASYDASSELNSTTSLKNLIGNSYHGTISGATFSNNKLYFDGLNDYVKLRAYNLSNITLAASFDVPSLNSKTNNIISNIEYGGCIIGIGSQNKAFGSCYINGAYRYIYSKTEISANTKYDAVLTYDGTKLEFYLNDVSQGSYESTSGITVPDDSTIYMIGVNPNGSNPVSDYFKGNLYKLKIYSRALTSNEVLNLDL